MFSSIAFSHIYNVAIKVSDEWKQWPMKKKTEHSYEK